MQPHEPLYLMIIAGVTTMDNMLKYPGAVFLSIGYLNQIMKQ